MELTPADSLLFLGHFEQALIMIGQAKEGVVSLGNATSTFLAELQWGLVLYHLGKYHDSLSHLTEIRARPECNRYKVLHVLCLLGIANNHISVGNLTASQECVETASHDLPRGN